MRSRTVFCAVIAAITILGVATLGSPLGSAANRHAPLRFIALDAGPGTSVTNIDNGTPNRLDVGDGFAEVNVLVTPMGRRVGRLEFICTFPAVSPAGDDPLSQHCTGIAFLKEGRLMFYGALLGPSETFAVIGGTRRYLRARGQVALRILSEHRTSFVFTVQ
jgi:hypothetical protein